MEKKNIIFMLLILLSLFMFGCSGNKPVAPVSNTISFDTSVGTGAANIVALPAAIEGRPYAVAIQPTGGNGPYVCASVPPGTNIIGNIQLNAACVITGTAPILSPGTTHGIYPVVFNIRDVNGVLAGPFQLALEVVKPERGQGAAQPNNQQTGQNPQIQNNPSQPTNTPSEKETWKGTFHTSRPACYDFDTETTQGKFDGVFTATMTISAKLADVVSRPNDFDTDSIFSYDKKNYEFTWSGSESVAEQCKDVEKYDLNHYQAVGSSVSNKKPTLRMNYGTTPAKISVTSDTDPLLPGGYNKYRRNISESTLNGMEKDIVLIPTSVSDTEIKGTIIYTLKDIDIGTFTFIKQQ